MPLTPSSRLIYNAGLGVKATNIIFSVLSQVNKILLADIAIYWLILLLKLFGRQDWIIDDVIWIIDGMIMLPILAGIHTVSLLEVLHEVALIMYADGDDDLLDGQESSFQQFTGSFDAKPLAVSGRGGACLGFKKMLQTRVGEVNRGCHFADRKRPVKVTSHQLYYLEYS